MYRGDEPPDRRQPQARDGSSGSFPEARRHLLLGWSRQTSHGKHLVITVQYVNFIRMSKCFMTDCNGGCIVHSSRKSHANDLALRPSLAGANRGLLRSLRFHPRPIVFYGFRRSRRRSHVFFPRTRHETHRRRMDGFFCGIKSVVTI